MDTTLERNRTSEVTFRKKTGDLLVRGAPRKKEKEEEEEERGKKEEEERRGEGRGGKERREDREEEESLERFCVCSKVAFELVALFRV